MKLNLKSVGKRGIAIASGLILALAAISITLLPSGQVQAIGAYVAHQVYSGDLWRHGPGFYYYPTVMEKPDTVSRRVPCSNDPDGYRNIYINAAHVWGSYGANEANFRIRYYPNWPSTSGSFNDQDVGNQYGWVFVRNYGHESYIPIGVCVKAGAHYRVETDRRVTFRFYD